MHWQSFKIASDCTHHITPDGVPSYAARFDNVLKFHAPGLAPVSLGATAWHIRPDGSDAYARRFSRTFGFYEDLAAVITPEGWHHIVPDGCDAYVSRHAWCGNFQEGLCAIRETDDLYFHITRDGKPAYNARWQYAGDFREGVAVVQSKEGLSTHIDAGGRQLHGCWFFDLDVFHKGFARARDAIGWMHVDKNGISPYIHRRFAAIEPFYNGQARVECFDGAFEVIDESGQTLVRLRPPVQSEFPELSIGLVEFWGTQALTPKINKINR